MPESKEVLRKKKSNHNHDSNQRDTEAILKSFQGWKLEQFQQQNKVVLGYNPNLK